MAVTTMRDLLIEELREIYDAEKRATKAYPRLIRAAASDRLTQVLGDHLEETRRQIKRLEEIFAELDLSTRAKSCEAIRGFVADAEARLRADMPTALRDVALIAEAQKIEHFEIAAYGSVHAFAQALGLDRVVTLLKETLDEEKAADRKLNEVAVKDVNRNALQAAAGRPAAARGRKGERAARPARGTATAGASRGRRTAAARGKRATPGRQPSAAARPARGKRAAAPASAAEAGAAMSANKPADPASQQGSTSIEEESV